MSRNIENSAPIIERQGQETDADQHSRLEKGIDIVYAHLATLATAAAFNGIQWDVEEGRRGGSDKLVAVRHFSDRKDFPMVKNNADTISSNLPVEGESRLTAKIKLSNHWNRPHYVLPKPDWINFSLGSQARGRYGSFETYLESSKVVLERPNQVHGAKPMTLGVKATHAESSEAYTHISLVKDVRQADEFSEISALLNPNAEEAAERGGEEGRREYRLYPDRNITTLAPAHFAFHEALGIPLNIVDLGRRNFTTLVDYANLPNKETYMPVPEPVEVAEAETQPTN